MKAVILAAGEGTRLKPITSTIPKPLIPLAGYPLLEHNIKALSNAGIEDILLIVGYLENKIRSYFNNASKRLGVNLSYITQEEYLGTAHATGYSRDFVGNDSFLMMYGDLLVESSLFNIIIEKFGKSNSEGLITLLEVNNPQNYGIISLDPEGYVTKITEKPPAELNLGNLANAGIYLFKPSIFEAIDRTKLSPRNEYEFTDSMEILMNELGGKIIGYVLEDAFWSDIGLPWQLLDANRYLMQNIERKIEGKVEENVQIKGNVCIGEGTIVKSGSFIEGPCFIGKNCLIGPNAYIRPNSLIQDNCHVGISEIKNSLIFSNTNIPHFNYVGDSVICENVNLGAGTKVANLRLDEGDIKVFIKGKRINSGRRKLGMIVGPNVKIGINCSIMCGKKIGENSKIGAHTMVNEDVPSNKLYYYDSNQGNVIKNLKNK
ncbi:MAG: NTP transferase domain-containing protein [Candidatus Lokiarchaeota archaeon]|nr:NTP transferase domain-containing protein [Candidatus Lokiarchaeota archaeon]MBD3198557.1 NTP transferase domain-containing protein [Candidatus Lokiarchaeota archaeon]